MSSVKCWWPTLMIRIMHENYALLLNKGPTIEIWVKVQSPNFSQTQVLYSSKSTFLTFSSQIPTNSVNLTKFLPFPYMRNIEYLRTTIFLLWGMAKLLRFSVVYYEILTKSCEEFSYGRTNNWNITKAKTNCLFECPQVLTWGTHWKSLHINIHMRW